MKKTKIHFSDERHSRELESLGSVFIPIMKDVMSAEDFVEADILLRWLDIIGEEIAGFCNPLKTKFDIKKNERTLFVEVPVGGFALELRHQEDYILEKINAYFGYKAVHKLNINQNANMKLRSVIRLKKKNEERLNKDEEQYLEELTSEIKDEKLREILIKLGKSVILANKGAK
ncbi:MAG: DUF721 domain-containing protein [Acetobacter sp.]|nr:DUF721 domain-containing protein [Acetobacter sp.]